MESKKVSGAIFIISVISLLSSVRTWWSMLVFLDTRNLQAELWGNGNIWNAYSWFSWFSWLLIVIVCVLSGKYFFGRSK